MSRELYEHCVAFWTERDNLGRTVRDVEKYERSDGAKFTRVRNVDRFGMRDEWRVVELLEVP